jgi:hypothetical protein
MFDSLQRPNDGGHGLEKRRVSLTERLRRKRVNAKHGVVMLYVIPMEAGAPSRCLPTSQVQ